MSIAPAYLTPDDAQREKLLAIVADSFGPIPHTDWVDQVGKDNFRVLLRDGQVTGGCGFLKFGHFFGGKRVSAVGIGGVAVAAEYRGDGSAKQLLENVLRELHQADVALSSLYPATVKLYRRAGYEFAGHSSIIRLPLESIDTRERGLDLQPLDLEAHRSLIQQLYRESAQDQPGHLDRNDFNWRRLFTDWEDNTRLGYLVKDGAAPVGYMIYNHEPSRGPKKLEVRDWAALTPAAARRLLTLLADHRTVRHEADIVAPPHEWLFSLLGEYQIEYRRDEHWMLRIVNLPRALEARGYPSGVSGEVHLNIADDVVPENGGHWVLSVADGCGQVSRGGSGQVGLDIRGLASLYGSYHSAKDLARIGYLSGDCVPVLDAIFAGPCAWMRDWF